MLAVVGFPTLAPEDERWIDRVRAAHDPRHGVIAAHVTLVFPVEIASAAVEPHVAAVAAAQPAFAFDMHEVRAVRDAHAGHGGHVFLVVRERASEIVALHDRLYEGPLAPHLRRDLAFVPHITIAASDDFAHCERLAAELQRELPPIRGEIRALTILDVQATGLRPIAVHRLAA